MCKLNPSPHLIFHDLWHSKMRIKSCNLWSWLLKIDCNLTNILECITAWWNMKLDPDWQFQALSRSWQTKVNLFQYRIFTKTKPIKSYNQDCRAWTQRRIKLILSWRTRKVDVYKVFSALGNIFVVLHECSRYIITIIYSRKGGGRTTVLFEMEINICLEIVNHSHRSGH